MWTLPLNIELVRLLMVAETVYLLRTANFKNSICLLYLHERQIFGFKIKNMPL